MAKISKKIMREALLEYIKLQLIARKELPITIPEQGSLEFTLHLQGKIKNSQNKVLTITSKNFKHHAKKRKFEEEPI